MGRRNEKKRVFSLKVATALFFLISLACVFIAREWPTSNGGSGSMLLLFIIYPILVFEGFFTLVSFLSKSEFVIIANFTFGAILLLVDLFFTVWYCVKV